MAWHLSEIDGCLSFGIAERRFDLADDLPELKRPKEVEKLAPSYRRVHELALERLGNLKPHELDEKVTFFDGTPMTIREVLWGAMLHHFIHHRAQLVLLCRQAGGMPPGLYGPNREEMQAIREKWRRRPREPGDTWLFAATRCLWGCLGETRVVSSNPIGEPYQTEPSGEAPVQRRTGALAFVAQRDRLAGQQNPDGFAPASAAALFHGSSS
jgi:hypothetical protein